MTGNVRARAWALQARLSHASSITETSDGKKWEKKDLFYVATLEGRTMAPQIHLQGGNTRFTFRGKRYA